MKRFLLWLSRLHIYCSVQTNLLLNLKVVHLKNVTSVILHKLIINRIYVLINFKLVSYSFDPSTCQATVIVNGIDVTTECLSEAFK